MTLDSVDLRILRMLAKNSRITLNEIAKEVGLSLPGARRRVKKLERLGIIQQYTILTDPKKCGAELLAFIQVEVEANEMEALISKLGKRNEVLEIHRVTGQDSLLIKARFGNMDEMNLFIKENLHSEGARRVSTWVVLESYKEKPFSP
ncbi:MAG: Lrp/AsnC family transcriptional regulator [Candidatus Hadarchaeales archaeon]